MSSAPRMPPRQNFGTEKFHQKFTGKSFFSFVARTPLQHNQKAMDKATHQHINHHPAATNTDAARLESCAKSFS